MKKSLTIAFTAALVAISILEVLLISSCQDKGSGISEDQTTVTLKQVIQQVVALQPGPQVAYIIEGRVRQIDDRKLSIERNDKVTVTADIIEGLRIETLNEIAEGSPIVTKPMLFREIIIGDSVKLWVQIFADGSFEQTRLLVNIP